MDIHAPEGPTHSLKDFAIHIVIVTIGILIALGLEGVRESIHEHRQVAETREIFHDELVENGKQLRRQRTALNDSTAHIDSMLAHLDELNRTPGEVAKAMDGISPGFYFLTTSSWETALSTGVLDHMSPAEVDRFSAVTLSVRNYVNIQNQAIQHFYGLDAIFHAKPTLSAAQLDEGRVQLIQFRLYCGTMGHLLDELSNDMGKAEKR